MWDFFQNECQYFELHNRHSGRCKLLGVSKVKRLEAENGQLKQDITDLQERGKAEQVEQKNMEHRHYSEIDKIYRAHQQETMQYDERLKRIDTYSRMSKN